MVENIKVLAPSKGAVYCESGISRFVINSRYIFQAKARNRGGGFQEQTWFRKNNNLYRSRHMEIFLSY